MNMNTFKTRINPVRLVISAALVTLGVAALSAPSTAGAAEPLRMTVSYGDLNIDSPAGAKALYARLQYAAGQVCAPLDGRTGPVDWWYRECVKATLDGAVAKVNHPMLTAMHMRGQSVAGG